MTIRACVEGVDENGGRKEEEAEVEAQQQNWRGGAGGVQGFLRDGLCG